MPFNIDCSFLPAIRKNNVNDRYFLMQRCTEYLFTVSYRAIKVAMKKWLLFGHTSSNKFRKKIISQVFGFFCLPPPTRNIKIF